MTQWGRNAYSLRVDSVFDLSREVEPPSQFFLAGDTVDLWDVDLSNFAEHLQRRDGYSCLFTSISWKEVGR